MAEPGTIAQQASADRAVVLKPREGRVPLDCAQGIGLSAWPRLNEVVPARSQCITGPRRLSPEPESLVLAVPASAGTSRALPVSVWARCRWARPPHPVGKVGLRCRTRRPGMHPCPSILWVRTGSESPRGKGCGASISSRLVPASGKSSGKRICQDWRSAQPTRAVGTTSTSLVDDHSARRLAASCDPIASRYRGAQRS